MWTSASFSRSNHLDVYTNSHVLFTLLCCPSILLSLSTQSASHEPFTLIFVYLDASSFSFAWSINKDRWLVIDFCKLTFFVCLYTFLFFFFFYINVCLCLLIWGLHVASTFKICNFCLDNFIFHHFISLEWLLRKISPVLSSSLLICVRRWRQICLFVCACCISLIFEHIFFSFFLSCSF